LPVANILFQLFHGKPRNDEDSGSMKLFSSAAGGFVIARPSNKIQMFT